MSLFVVSLLGCRREALVHDLSEREANKILTELHGERIEATKRVEPNGLYALEVEPAAMVEALRYLENNRLLRERSTVKAEGSPFGGTREERRFRFERSMSREIEVTLERVPGVREARVHLNLPPTESIFGGGEGKSPASGSVLIVASAKTMLEREAVAAIVSGAAGLSPAAVTVVIHVAKGIAELPVVAPSATLPVRAESLVWGLTRSVRWPVAGALLVIGGALLFVGLRPVRRRGRVATA